MKILLTGMPGIGKSTLLSKVLDGYKGRKIGFRSVELREKGKRVGFVLINHLNEKSIFMSVKKNLHTKIKIANKYYVDVNAIDIFVSQTFAIDEIDSANLVYIDEIGRAQIHSEEFKELMEKLFNSDKPLICTVVFDAEPWSLAYKTHEDTILIKVDEKNRDSLAEIISAILNSLEEYETLKITQKEYIKKELLRFLDQGMYIQAKKLFFNTVHYVANNLIEVHPNIKDSYVIKGRTTNHIVCYHDKSFNCDCDLFNGKGKYQGSAGVCSHIEAVNLFTI